VANAQLSLTTGRKGQDDPGNEIEIKEGGQQE